MRKISKTMKPIRKHIINTASSQNLVLIHSRQEKVATLKRGICLSSRSQPTNFKCPNSWSSNTLANWFKEPTHWKRPRCWKRMKTGGEGATEDKTVGWHHRLNVHEFEQTPGGSGGQRSLTCCNPWCQNRVRHDWWLNNNNNNCFKPTWL